MGWLRDGETTAVGVVAVGGAKEAEVVDFSSERCAFSISCDGGACGL